MNCSGEFKVINERGLHARPASLFVQEACAHDSEVKVQNLETGVEADGKSLMSMLVLAAPCGTTLKISTDGADAQETLKALGDIILGGFDEL